MISNDPKFNLSQLNAYKLMINATSFTWTKSPFEWTKIDIYYLLFVTWPTVDFPLTDPPPPYFCPHSYWMPLYCSLISALSTLFLVSSKCIEIIVALSQCSNHSYFSQSSFMFNHILQIYSSLKCPNSVHSTLSLLWPETNVTVMCEMYVIT